MVLKGRLRSILHTKVLLGALIIARLFMFLLLLMLLMLFLFFCLFFFRVLRYGLGRHHSFEMITFG